MDELGYDIYDDINVCGNEKQQKEVRHYRIFLSRFWAP